MGDLKFILGFVAGWIATTQEGKVFATKVANTAIAAAKPYLEKKKEKAEE